MQTVVNFHDGSHINFIPFAIAATLLFFVAYIIISKKSAKKEDKQLPSRSDTYHYMYSQLLEKEAASAE